MRVEVLWTLGELDGLPIQGRVAVVVDVIRAATTVATAIHNGARAIVPAASTEEALRIADSLGRDQVLLCGERQGLRIEGFDLGNSPEEFTPEVVGERTIVMTTTNGTRALKALTGAERVYVAAFVNLSAVAEELIRTGSDPLIVCAGREGRVGVDDALCAGLLVQATRKAVRGSGSSGTLELGDGAIAAVALAKQHSVTTRFLRGTGAGRALNAVNQGADIKFCAEVDTIPEVPVLRDRQITRLGSGRTLSEGATG